MSVFGLPILLSAFLLFQVQPMAAKAILPWFGGSPAVWTTSMLFFQALLLAGYLYADRLVTILAPRAQTRLHLLLLAATILALPLGIDAGWKPSGAEEPVPRILALLTLSVGMPYFALATTGPLLQAWAAAGGRSPYRLYAVSNFGSLAALLSYPVWVEPVLTTGQQFRLWSCGYAAYVFATGFVALRSGQRPREDPASDETTNAVPLGLRSFLWTGLSACASVLLLAVTNQICQEVAVVPFLWLLPLTVYLLSFILCFDSDRWYRRGAFLPALLAASALCVYAVIRAARLSVPVELAIYTVYLFVACMVCHGELVSLRPGRGRLTQFYMLISLGGALGGAFVALAAPALFSLFLELHVGVVACLVLAAVAVIARSPQSFRHERWRWFVWFEATLAISAFLFLEAGAARGVARVAARNFYGTLRVVELQEPNEAVARRHLMHGLTNHGFQFLGAERRHAATSYYGPRSAVGVLLSSFRPGQRRRVGVLGLGTGTIAAYGRPEDTFRFFEINPLVARFAQTEFTFLADSAARIEIVVADARLALEREQGEPYDVIIADAFSGDAVPVHLLTEEAFRLYFSRLAPGGVLAMNISNRMLDLSPVVAAAADELDVDAVIVDSDGSSVNGWFRALWVLLATKGGSLRSLSFDSPSSRLQPLPQKRILWRDDYSNLIQILK